MKTMRVWKLAAGLAVLLAGLAPSASAVNATGGDVTTSGVYRIHTFTNVGTSTFTVLEEGNVEVLVVAGGGGGAAWVGGGGGAGGFQTNAAFPVLAGDYSVQVGIGGAAGPSGTAGGTGGASVFSNGASFIVSTGGGGGGTYPTVLPTTGGSGGGGGGNGASVMGTNGIPGQGNSGGNGYAGQWAGGGGGGAGGPGTNATPSIGGAGGVGLLSSISGSATYYAGGGGGCSDGNSPGSNGGLGGGGKGRSNAANPPQNGATSTGGGGGGARDVAPAGSGGSGIVIVRYFWSDIYTLLPTNVTATSASLNGYLAATGVTDTAVFVYYGPTDGGANPDNWAATNMDLAAPQNPGDKTVTVTVPAGGETFYRFAVSNSEGLVWAASSQYFISTNVAISVTPATVGEVNNGATFSFIRPEALTNGALTVNFTIGGSAANGSDYSPVSAVSVTLPVGVASATLPVTTLPDVMIEGDETVELTETVGTYVLNDPATTTLTIADSPTLTTLLPSDVTSTSASLNGYLTSTGNYESAVHVYYGPTDGGNNPANWAETNASLSSPQSVGSKTVSVAVTPGIQYFYRYAASNVWGISMASNSQYFLTANVAISAVPDTIPEVSGVSQFRFTRPQALASGAVTVNFTLGGTAIGGTDYATITATSVTLAVGATSATVQVSGLVDFLTEGGESVVLTQTAGAYPLNSPPTTTLTITDATVPAWTLTTNTVVLQQGANIVVNGMMYGEIYTNTVDTYIDRAFPTNSYESATVIRACGHDNIPAGGSSTRGFLRFDNLQAYVPSNAIVISARLRLTSAGDGVGDSAAGFFCRLAAWNPTNTWNALAGTASGQQLGSTIHGVWFAWAVDAVGETDLGAVVQAWMQGSLTNHGILFRSPEDNTTYRERRFYSSEYETTSKRPKLTIVYAVTNAQVSPVGYERFSPVTRHVVVLSGSNIIQDTYINGDSDTTKTSNYSTATMVTLQTRNGQGVKRALLQINTGSGLLSTFSASTAPTNSLNKRLVNAKLRLSVPSFFQDASPGIWTCNQPWSPTTATFYTRDGSTSWDQPWLSNANQNVGPLIGSFVFQYSPFLGGCAYVDVTSTLQAWINGTNNYGLVLGYAGSDYVSYVALTEHAIPALRPTLVLEYYELPKARGAIILIR